ncbi:hypothetical protein R1T16_10055 [Flavobacterium sp. DG1-102-2]|uniref:hypothetical protein n=1 Tax=Flavobacterium sp. DG1-102-2 TaxID=3081663 RepID=UPI002949B47B|nr:hypothetical protein [Flavobacterium sp. DG1-102-2]MDV6168769.1 hypothetical protein [Flavobacterium sp. DG1-102-2]
MANYTIDRHDLGDLGGYPDNMNTSYNFTFPYEDPAIINPEELASFPKTTCPSHSGTYPHHESHLVNRKYTHGDGKNITITDNHL